MQPSLTCELSALIAPPLLARGADVPNLTIGPMVCKALKNYGIKAPIDVHLMVTPVDAIIQDFADAGADFITFHPEATTHVRARPRCSRRTAAPRGRATCCARWR